MIEPAASLLPEIADAIQTFSVMRLKEIFRDKAHDKLSRDDAVNLLRNDVFDKIKTNFADITDLSLVIDCFNQTCKNVFRDSIFEMEMRCDGRDIEQLRNISCQVLITRVFVGDKTTVDFEFCEIYIKLGIHGMAPRSLNSPYKA